METLNFDQGCIFIQSFEKRKEKFEKMMTSADFFKIQLYQKFDDVSIFQKFSVNFFKL